MASFFSPSTLERVRAANDIVDVIGASLPLKRAGQNFVALCPFHKEKSPSFNVNPHKQIFHCFGCHKGGDVFSFVREYEGLNFSEAVRRLAERAKIPLEADTEGNAPERGLKDLLLQIHEQIAQRWQAALANDAAGQIGRDYLAKRKVPAEAVKLFRLGYAPDLWDDTVNWAKSKGYDLAVVEQAGLIIKKDDRYYDRFRGRLMFPICDEQGRVVGFSGRVLSGDEKTAKYVNSPETPIFTKGKVFYGLDKSKRAILDQQSAIICEGQLDLIACFMAGVQNIVAPQGTALTAGHARILKRYADEVVLCFDSDLAGQKAAIRSLDDLLASGLAIRVATVPAPHDPDSYIKENGSEAFKELVQRAEGFFDFYLNYLCLTNDPASDRGRLAIAREMGEAVWKTGSTVLADTYAQKTAHRLGVSIDAARAEFRQSRAKHRSLEPANEPDPPVTEATPERPSQLEFWLLRLLLMDDELIEWAMHHLDLEWVQHHGVRLALQKRFAAQGADEWRGLAGLLDEIEDAFLRALVTEAVAEQRTIPNRFQQLMDIVKKLRDTAIDRRMLELTRQTSNPGISTEEQHRIVAQQNALRQLKRQPLQPLADSSE